MDDGPMATVEVVVKAWEYVKHTVGETGWWYMFFSVIGGLVNIASGAEKYDSFRSTVAVLFVALVIGTGAGFLAQAMGAESWFSNLISVYFGIASQNTAKRIREQGLEEFLNTVRGKS